jgi:hypothetical protein
MLVDYHKSDEVFQGTHMMEINADGHAKFLN